MDKERTQLAEVTRWTTAIVSASPNGGFVSYADYLSLIERIKELERVLQQVYTSWQKESMLDVQASMFDVQKALASSQGQKGGV